MNILQDKSVEIRRGDIWYVRSPGGVRPNKKFNSADKEIREGSVQRYDRPYVVCQSDMGGNSSTVIVAPVSTAERKEYPFLQEIMLKRVSKIHYEQLDTIPKRRLQHKWGRLSKEQIEEMDKRLAVPVGLSKSSILHIKRVIVHGKEDLGGVIMYHGIIHFENFSSKFCFTEEELTMAFGRRIFSKFDSKSLRSISELLETLDGLKFVYRLVEGG